MTKETSAFRGLWSLPRNLLARMFGTEGAGKRDLYNVFGWDRMITVQAMFEMYHRGGIAQRVVDAYPDATWAHPPEVYQDVKENDGWTRAFAELAKNTNLYDALHRADRLSRLGRYAIILVGYDQANLAAPVRGNSRKVLYFQPYSELSAKITEWNTNSASPRFGMPEFYTIYPDLANNEQRGGTMTGDGKMPSRGSFRVHASRVVHVAQGVMEDEVFGTPMLGSIWNYLCDLMKVVGGSAESYWLTANRGMQVDIDKDAELSDEDAAALSEEVDEYSNQMRRVLRTRGVKVTDLGSRVADPRGPYAVLMQLISGTKGIPQRILLGSEAGHLASTQDKGNWAEQVENNRALGAEPRLLKPLIQNLIAAKALPTPKADVVANWPDAYRSGPLERAEISSKISLAANNLGLMFKNMTPPDPKAATGAFGKPAAPNQPGAAQRQPATPGGTSPRTQAEAEGEAPATDASKLKPFITEEEARAIIGFSTDNRVLEDTPLSESHARRVLLKFNSPV